MVAPVAVGWAAGNIGYGLIATVGSFTSLYGSGRPYVNRAGQLGVIAASFGVAVALGDWAAAIPWVGVVTGSVIAMAAVLICNALADPPRRISARCHPSPPRRWTTSASRGWPSAVHDGRMAERDRDESGRPRNTRPRDALGRPLPHGSDGVPRVPDELQLPPGESLSLAQDLLDRGLAFTAHEVLEAAWKNGPDDERELWQGLAQLAVGITHVQRGNTTGAIALLRRASVRLTQDEQRAPHGIDIAGLVRFAGALIDDLTADVEIRSERLRPRLAVDA